MYFRIAEATLVFLIIPTKKNTLKMWMSNFVTFQVLFWNFNQWEVTNPNKGFSVYEIFQIFIECIMLFNNFRGHSYIYIFFLSDEHNLSSFIFSVSVTLRCFSDGRCFSIVSGILCCFYTIALLYNIVVLYISSCYNASSICWCGNFWALCRPLTQDPT